jgi:hypothetical protein
MIDAHRSFPCTLDFSARMKLVCRILSKSFVTFVAATFIGGCANQSRAEIRTSDAIVTAVLRDKHACASYHTIYVFQNRTVHYVAADQSRSPPGGFRFAEADFKLDHGQLKGILDLVYGFRLEEEPVLFADGPGGPHVLTERVTFSAEDVERFRTTLDGMLHITWAEFPPGTDSPCKYQGPNSYVKLKGNFK